MFFRRRIFPVFLFALLGLMLLGGMRSSAYRYGYFDGVQAAQTAVAADAESGGEASISPNHAYYGHHHHSFFGGFFRFIFTFFLMMFLFKTLFRWRWYRRHGRHHRHHRHHWKKWPDEHHAKDTRSAKEKAADEGLDYIPQDL